MQVWKVLKSRSSHWLTRLQDPFFSMVRGFIPVRTMCIVADLSNRRDLRGIIVNSSTISFWVVFLNRIIIIFRPYSSPKRRVEAWSSALFNTRRCLLFWSRLRDSHPDLALFPSKIFSFAAWVADSWPWPRLFHHSTETVWYLPLAEVGPEWDDNSLVGRFSYRLMLLANGVPHVSHSHVAEVGLGQDASSSLLTNFSIGWYS